MTSPGVATEIIGLNPGAWAALVVAAIAAVALAVHLRYTLAEKRGAPMKLTETLRSTINDGNYQEAWEECDRWRSAFLARILQPALERIGQGKERVDAALERKFSREQRLVTAFTWALIGVGVIGPLLCLSIGWVGYAALSRTDEAGVDGRVITMAAGNFSLLAAAAFAVTAMSGILWFGFRARSRRLLPMFRADAERLMKGLAYDDLEGLRIGKDFDAGTILGAEGEVPAPGKLRVSRELTTACPKCNAPINPSRNLCPHCGAPLEWS